MAIPIVDTQRDEIFRPEGVAPAIIGNPLAEDAAVMRSSGVVSMISAIEWNLNRGQRNLRLFEIGKRYELRDGEPVETAVLTLGATGLAREKSIYEPAREFTFADLKGDLDRIGELASGLRLADRSACMAHSRSIRSHRHEPEGLDLELPASLHGVSPISSSSARIFSSLRWRWNPC